MSIQVLVVDDDATISRSVSDKLTGAGYAVSVACSGEEAFFMASSQSFDVMVLDLGLPGRDGREVLSALRRNGKALPVLILSAQSEIETRVDALRTGADDFLTKPFSMLELEARLQALLRRGRPERDLRLVVHDLTLDIALRRVERGNHLIELTGLEFDILELLMRHANQVVSRDMLARAVWKEVQRVTPIDNLIDVHIGRLRKKVDVAGLRPLIHTKRGVGFTLSDKAL
jgi:DNA-binding response OmpR family regulator